MSDFDTVCEGLANLDPYKHVNYVNGLVLGVDEFVQEQLYFLEKHRLHNRTLHGYGTVCGLRVVANPDGGSPRVMVEPGIAVDRAGREIRVTTAQCANLNRWLENHRQEIEAFLSASPVASPQPLSLYLTLCFRECKTDQVPIPGGPCKTLAESSAASRIKDAFELKLSLVPPLQSEQEAVIRFVDLLKGIEISNAPDGMSVRDIEDLVREMLEPPASPSLLDSLHMHPDEVPALMKAAMRVWVTEIRPKLSPGGQNCLANHSDEACLLLAELNFDLDAVFHVVGGVSVIEDDRPYLLHTGLLQEWLLREGMDWRNSQPPREFATLGWLEPATIRIWLHYPIPLHLNLNAVAVQVEPGESPAHSMIDLVRAEASDNVFDLTLDRPLAEGQQVTVVFDSVAISLAGAKPETLAESLQHLDYHYVDQQGSRLYAFLPILEPSPPELRLGDLIDVEADSPSAADGDVLTWDGNVWRPNTPELVVTSHSALTDLASDDHQQYLLADGSRPLSGDFSAGNHKITGLAAATAAGDAVRYEQAVKIGDAAAGDLDDRYPNPQVRGLRNRPVSGAAPNSGDVLAWNGAQWAPRASEPVSEDFVRVPRGTGVYAIVAAGIFDINGNPLGLQFNKLRVRRVQPNQYLYLLRFPGYQPPAQTGIQPPDDIGYIVKGTIISYKELPGIFQFESFEDNGIVVTARPLGADALISGFMVEISAYGKLDLG